MKQVDNKTTDTDFASVSCGFGIVKLADRRQNPCLLLL